MGAALSPSSKVTPGPQEFEHLLGTQSEGQGWGVVGSHSKCLSGTAFRTWGLPPWGRDGLVQPCIPAPCPRVVTEHLQTPHLSSQSVLSAGSGLGTVLGGRMGQKVTGADQGQDFVCHHAVP